MNTELYLKFLQDIAEKGNVQEAAKCWEMLDPVNNRWARFGSERRDVPTFMPEISYRRKPKPHPHAELMLAFAKDALQTEEPWLHWEFQRPDNARWIDCSALPSWNTSYKYRRKG